MAILDIFGYSILPFLAILIFLVVMHELGHFITAKLAGVRVLEFGLGYPPKLWGHRFGTPSPCPVPAGGLPAENAAATDERTEYTVNLLPLGGFVRLLGEEDPGDPRSLAAKPKGIRIIILAAGALVNLALPVLLFTANFMIPQQIPSGRVIIQHVSPNSPAQSAGIQSLDQFIRINGDNIQNVSDVAYDIRRRQGQTMTWEIKRGRDTLTKQVYARWSAPEDVDPVTGKRVREGPTGIELSSPDPFTKTQSYPIWEALPKGFQATVDSLILARNEVISRILTRSSPPVQGPVGIAQATGEVAKQAGWAALLQFAALISINLGVMNLLPLPMLDGGRVLFVLLEVVRGGRRIAPEKEALVHFVGFVVLMSLVVVISYFDVARLIHGGSVFR